MVSVRVSPLTFSYELMKIATAGFNPKNKLGEGRFGSVFRGSLQGTDVAIKVLHEAKPGNEDMTDEQFHTEITMLSMFHHPNLVTLLGYSNDPGLPRCLIYEFMVNGTLQDALDFGVHVNGSEVIGLTWMARISIAIDAAKGLKYFHETITKSPPVHGNIKSASVLLDFSFHAKIGDFGLVQLGDLGNRPSQATPDYDHQPARIDKISSYIAPEYYRGVITTKLDTYAFGVVLLEILTGLPSYDPKRNQEYSDLVTFIEVMTRKPDFSVVQCVDERAGDWPNRSFLKLFSIAQRCLIENHFERPGMDEVYILLEGLSVLSGH